VPLLQPDFQWTACTLPERNGYKRIIHGADVCQKPL
jgi:hypothetical protein